MTQTVAPTPLDEAHFHHRPVTDGQAVRDTHAQLHHLHERIEEIKECPQEHHPKLVLSEHVRGSSLLDKIADGVNALKSNPSGPPLNNTQMPRMSRTPASVISATPRTLALTEIWR